MGDSNSQAGKVPPQLPPVFDATPESLISDAEKLVAERSLAWDNIAATVTPDTAKFENVILPIVHAENAQASPRRIILFYSSSSSDKALRDASKAATQLFSTAEIDILAREDMFILVDAVARKELQLDTESARYLEKLHKDLRVTGFGVQAGPDRDRYLWIRKRLLTVGTDYIHNLNSNVGGLWFSRDDLAGLPEDWIASHKQEIGNGEPTGRAWITYKPPDFNRVLYFAKKPETRRAMYLGRAGRVASTNVPLMKEAVVLRDEAARLLGYPNHASLKAEDTMVNNVALVNEFLTNQCEKLKRVGVAEIAEITAFRNEHDGNEGSDLFLWDHPYYVRVLKEEKYDFDMRKTTAYFPLDHTLTKLLGIFEHLFGIEFQRINIPGQIQCSTVHEDVMVFAIWDTDKGDEFIGYVYLDFFPRENKYDHAGHTWLQAGFEKPDGSRHYPASVLMCNYPKPTATLPSLLDHGEMRSLFHELGHAMHGVLSKTKYSRFHGTRVARDFVELPSMMLENFFWNEENIRKVSLHYSYLSPEYAANWRAEQATMQQSSDSQAQVSSESSQITSDMLRLPPRQMPTETINKLLTTRLVLSGIRFLNQLHMAAFDQEIHTLNTHSDALSLNLNSIWNSRRKQITGLSGPEIEPGPNKDSWDWGYNHSHFRSIMGQNDAVHYTYTLGQVYSFDMFDSRFAKDTMSVEEGRRYRRMILEKGGSQPEWKTLTEYLGREPSSESFDRRMEAMAAGGRKQ